MISYFIDFTTIQVFNGVCCCCCCFVLFCFVLFLLLLLFCFVFFLFRFNVQLTVFRSFQDDGKIIIREKGNAYTFLNENLSFTI